MTGLVPELFQNAPAETVFCAKAALALGIAAFLVSVYYAWRHWRDFWFVTNHLRRRKEAGNPPPAGPLAACLDVLNTPKGFVTLLTPDAAWDLLRTRVDTVLEVQQGFVRLLTYAPLLVGLSGTMLGLAGLLPYLNPPKIQAETPALVRAAPPVTAPRPQGDAGAQPRRNSAQENHADVARSQLQGVFLGTLGGILGSLLGAIGGFVLSWSAGRSSLLVEKYVNLTVLPQIPEQRVSLKLEDSVLAVIDARVSEIAHRLASAVEPVAKRLAEVALHSSRAAEQATAAFAAAAEAVSEAGNLEKAAKHLSTGLRHMTSAAGDLGDAAVAVRDAARVQQQLSEGLENTARDVGAATREMGTSMVGLEGLVGTHSARVEEAVASLQRTLADVRTEITQVTEAFASLSTDVRTRNTQEAETMRRAKETGDAFNAAIKAIQQQLPVLEQELLGLRQVLEDFAQRAGGAIGEDLRRRVDFLCERLAGALDPVAGAGVHAAAQLRTAGDDVKRRFEEANLRVPEMASAVQQLDEALKQNLIANVDLLARIEALRSQVSEGHGGAVTIDMTPLLDWLKKIDTSVSSVRSELKNLIQKATMESKKGSLLRRIFGGG